MPSILLVQFLASQLLSAIFRNLNALRLVILGISMSIGAVMRKTGVLGSSWVYYGLRMWWLDLISMLT